MEDTGLPVEEVVGPLREALDARGVAVLVAPPGSGKTTVVPLRLLDTVAGRILVLEPRRLATRAAARRMAALLDEPLGRQVGYVTRHDRVTGPTARIEVVTEGVLTRRLQADPQLTGTSLVIFDELHERNLQTDLGLALSLDVRRQLRPDLRLLAMSATIRPGPVSAILGDAPVIEAGTAAFPVDLRWVPAPPRNRLPETHVAAVVRRALEETDGDVLVFLPGMAEIRRVQGLLEGVLADVRLLHGSLPTEDQDLALAPSSPPFRKVVLSTDIAESSLTVEGVAVVVDAGTARVPRFDPRTGMTRLRTVPVSRASADQRAGRAGRLGPGVAYRLWSRMEHGTRRPDIDPEITQVDLAGLALELAAWGVSDPAELSWLDPPPGRAWDEAVSLLQGLGALDGSRLTVSGRRMATLPLHPRLARMVTDAGPDRALAIWLAAIIDQRDPLRGAPGERPADAALRVRLLTDLSFRHRLAVPGALQRLRQVAADLARRVDSITADQTDLAEVDLERVGPVLALAFPDRLAVRRGSPGRFQLRTGTTAYLDPSDPLAAEEFVVAADLDGRRKDARIRLAGGIDRSDVAAAFSHQVSRHEALTWEGDRLVLRTETRLGGMVLDTGWRRPQPGAATVRALLARIEASGPTALPWSGPATQLRARVTRLRESLGEPWPDWSDAALARQLGEWLAPYLPAATGWDDVADLDLVSILRQRLGRPLALEADRLAPTHLTTPSGRKVRIDYTRSAPTASVPVQDVFGMATTPVVAGVPLVLELLSPAGRPVQVTADLEGFWTGSWHEVRKAMAGRYPKHSWPADPLAGR